VPTQLNIAIIHGIGINGPGYSKDLTKGIAREFNSILRTKLKTSDDYSKDLNFIEIVWDDLVADHQREFAQIFEKEFKHRAHKPHLFYWIATFLLIGSVLSLIFSKPWVFAALAFAFFILGTKMFQWARTKFAADFIDDIICYRNGDAKGMIQKRIDERLSGLAASSGAVPVTFISHSLGTVIASDYIWDSRHDKKLFSSQLSLCNFFTMGSPLALFSLQFGMSMFSDPISVDDKIGVWINIFDLDDPIAYPLKCLNAAYDKAVTKDEEVNVGLFGLAHVNYWTKKPAHRIIASKLAEDWLRSQS
jgi:hypothetical protein